MDRTWLVTLLLSAYGVFKEFRPSEPFLTEYLEGSSWSNLTNAQVNHEVYPVWVYSYLTMLVPVFLLTDWLKYKPLIVLEGVSYVTCWILLIVGRSVATAQIMEFVYGIATATEVAYYTYIYSAVPRHSFQRVTSYIRAAILVGRFLSGAVSQLTVSLHLLDYYQLNFVSLSSVCICLFLSCALPSVKHSLYFHHKTENQDGGEVATKDASPNEVTRIHEGKKDGGQVFPDEAIYSSSHHQDSGRLAMVSGLKKMMWQLKRALSNESIVKWCMWWAVATSANILVGNNIQPLWEQIYPSGESDDDKNIYNGAVEAAHTFLSAIAAFAVGHVNLLNWSRYKEAVLMAVCVVDGVVLYSMSSTDSIIVCYVLYVIFRTTYQMLITVASFEVAKRVDDESFGLVFGMNTFMALLLSTVVTAVLISNTGFAAPPTVQFEVYAGYFLFTAAIYAIFLLVKVKNALCGDKDQYSIPLQS